MSRPVVLAWTLALLATFALPAAAQSVPTVKEVLQSIEPSWYDAADDTWKRPDIDTADDRDWFSGFFGFLAGASTPMEILAWVILAAIAAFIVWLIIRAAMTTRRSGVSVRRPRDDPAERMRRLGDVLEDETLGTDVRAALSDAMARGDWNAAAGFLYASMLSALDQAGQIRLDRGTTNGGYVGQARRAGLDAAHLTAFEAAIELFERVWFGDGSVARHEVERLEPILAGFEVTAANEGRS